MTLNFLLSGRFLHLFTVWRRFPIQTSPNAKACAKKIVDFKKETMERKLNAIMAEANGPIFLILSILIGEAVGSPFFFLAKAMEAIKAAESKVKAHTEVGLGHQVGNLVCDLDMPRWPKSSRRILTVSGTPVGMGMR